jgi:AbrB family looped-hinge helix DNA binding protein
MAQYRIPKARGMRTRERAPKYEALPPYQPIHIPPVYHVTVSDRGRLVLPAEVREKLKIQDGDPVALTLHEDGLVTLQTREVALQRFTGMFKHLAKPGRLASDELIAERRREARMEDRKFREWKALHRRMKRR